jgi:hypothetical protein
MTNENAREIWKKELSRQEVCYVETNMSRKVDRTMETNGEGTYFQEGDLVRIKRSGEQGKVNAADGGVVYVLIDGTNETRLFSARVDEDALIEPVTVEGEEAGRVSTL